MAKRKTLSTIMAEDMAQKILDGALKPGMRLPTEADLCDQYEVSRTVVREAIARLRSDGLLVTEQGRGMFVSERLPTEKFEIDPASLSALPETISLLELRLSVEVESAALCALRRTQKEAATIRKKMEEVDSMQSDPDKVNVHYDFDFHLAIAKATKNPFFHSFLKFLEPTIVPRFNLGDLIPREIKSRYYAQIHDEHNAVMKAIEAQEPDAARSAMRLHLRNSLDRHKALSKAAGIDKDTEIPATGLTDLLGNLLEKNA